jgi:hypothetical protein
MSQIVTPAQIEARLYALSKEIDESHAELVDAEAAYNRIKSDYEIAMAKSRMTYASRTSAMVKITQCKSVMIWRYWTMKVCIRRLGLQKRQ